MNVWISREWSYDFTQIACIEQEVETPRSEQHNRIRPLDANSGVISMTLGLGLGIVTRITLSHCDTRHDARFETPHLHDPIWNLSVLLAKEMAQLDRLVATPWDGTAGIPLGAELVPSDENGRALDAVGIESPQCAKGLSMAALDSARDLTGLPNPILSFRCPSGSAMIGT